MEKNEPSTRANHELVERFLMYRRPEDYEMIVDCYLPMLHRVIYRIILNQEDADDLVQETFLRAYEKIATFQKKSQFSTWLCRIGVNLAITHIRKAKKVVAMEELPTVVDTKDTPKSSFESQEEIQRIHQAIADLPVKLRSVIVLYVIEDIKLKDIAVILKCPTATVYWRLHRARKILAKTLEVHDE